MGIVIYPPTIDWDYMKQRPQHLMSMFAKHGFPVLYFNKMAREGPVVTKAANRLYVINHANYFLKYIYPELQGYKKLYWTSWSKMLAKARRLNADLVVYDCVDDFPDWEHDELGSIGMADLIVCTADPLKQKMERIAQDKPISIVRNGCDWQHFASALTQETRQIEGVPPASGSKIGYIGAWAPWVNEQLLKDTAAAFPDSQIIIVGPKLREDEPNYGPNVFYLGYRDYADLPAILSYLDVCVIPFRLNRITESTNPIKVYEYLAAGKPVVATNMPELRKMRDVVHVAETGEQFLNMIRLALQTPKSNAHRLSQYAKSHSWEQRFAQIAALLKRHDPMFRPGLSLSRLDQMADGPPRAKSVKLVHSTVNSYYAKRNFPKDPPLAGRRGTAVYECYFKPETQATPIRPSSKVFLEFELSGPDLDAADAVVQIGVSHQPWNRATMTFSNRPIFPTAANVHHSHALYETLSVDVTAFVQGGGLPSFRFSSLHSKTIGIRNARLTIFEP